MRVEWCWHRTQTRALRSEWMPRYFFHVRDGQTFREDPEGSELPDLTAAHREALTDARHILADRLRAGEVLDGQRFEITDGDGSVLAVVPFKDVIRLP